MDCFTGPEMLHPQILRALEGSARLPTILFLLVENKLIEYIHRMELPDDADDAIFLNFVIQFHFV